MVTIPSPNPISNTGVVLYDYTVGPSTVISSGVITNQALTQVNVASLSQVKTSDKAYAKVGDTITYTVVLTNYGNVTASSVVMIDTIPTGASYISNSLQVDGSPISGDPNLGVTIPDVNAFTTATITYQVSVNTIPNPNPLSNQAVLDYTFIINPLSSPVSEESISNVSNSYVSQANIDTASGGFTKISNKNYADINDIIEYTIVTKNTGNTTANNVILIDTTPSGTTFIAGSVKVNSITIPSDDPNPPTGISLASILAGEVKTVNFSVLVITIPSPNPIENAGTISFDFVVDPSLPQDQGSGNSNIANTQVNNANFSSTGFMKYVDNNYAKTNDTLTYTIVLTNNGNVTATNVTFKDTIPYGYSFVTNSLTLNGSSQVGQSPAPPTGFNLGSMAALEIATITFQVLVVTIPTINPVINQAVIDYNYSSNPSDPAKSGSNVSNTTETTINEAIIDNTIGGGLSKYVDKQFFGTGDTITYTIVLKNTGNVTANNVVIIDTIPQSTTFIPNSMTLNGSALPGISPAPPTGANIGSIGPDVTSTVTFMVLVSTIPTSTPISNSASITFNFDLVPTIPNSGSGSGNSNTTSGVISIATIDDSVGGFTKYTSQVYGDLNDIIVYTLVLKNTGNADANNVILMDTVPYGMEFVTGSVMVQGVTIPSANPNTGVSLGTISAGATATVAFQVHVNTIPTLNPIQNSASVGFVYTVNPSIPNGQSGTGNSSTTSTQINNGNYLPSLGGLMKYSDRAYAKIGDTVTYTIVLVNKGTVSTVNTTVVDTLPGNITFVNDSILLNGGAQLGATVLAPTGFNLGTVAAGAVNTITFNAVVVSLPSTNPTYNLVDVIYKYTTDPSSPNGKTGVNETQGGQVEVNTAIISKETGYTKYVSSLYTSIKKNMTFTIAIKNSGNVTATNVTLSDTLPNGINFVPGTVNINNVNIPGEDPVPPATVAVGNISPGATSTVTFVVLVTTTPSPNPFTNSAIVDFNYTKDPSMVDGESGSAESNTTNTMVNSAIFSSFGSTFPARVNGEIDIYSPLNKIVVYSMYFTNIGNVEATNTLFTNTIPEGTTFIPNTVTINGVTIPGVNPAPPTGINFGTVYPDVTNTITFQVLLPSIPAATPTAFSAFATNTITIVNDSALISYNYTTDPLYPNASSGQDASNDTIVRLSYVDFSNLYGGFNKYQNKTFTEVGDTIMYTLVITNSGTVAANNVVLYDTIPVGTIFVTGSTTINGVPTIDNPQSGISLGTIPVGITSTVTFVVQVVSLPSNKTVSNVARIDFSYIVDPTIGNSISESAYSNPTNNSTFMAQVDTIKTASPSYADIGDTITYNVVFNNTGNVTANNITIYDTIPTNTKYINDSLSVNGVIKPGADPTLGYNVGTISPDNTLTVQFRVVVTTLPTVNPIGNSIFGNYDYVVDPSLPAKTGTTSATSNGTTINNAGFNTGMGGFNKYPSKAYVSLGETISYTLVLKNTGNTMAENVVLADTVPQGTTYVAGSVVVNGVSSSDEITTGVSLGNIGAGMVNTVVYSVVVTTITSNYKVINTANVSYIYSVDPTTTPKSGSNTSTVATSDQKYTNIVITSQSNKSSAYVGDTIVYQLCIRNTGNTPTNNVVVTTTLASGLAYVQNSTMVAGQSQESIITGVTIPTILPGQCVTVSFATLAVSVPRGGIAINDIHTNYSYVVDPSLPAYNGSASGKTNPVVISHRISNEKVVPTNVKCNDNTIGGASNLMSKLIDTMTVSCDELLNDYKQYRIFGICSPEDYACANLQMIQYKMWQEQTIDSTITLTDEIADLDSIEAMINVIRSDKITTPNTGQCSSLEGKKLSGYKQIIEVVLRYKIKFVNKMGNLCERDYYKLISSFIVLNPDYSRYLLEVKGCIEDINITKLCGDKISFSTSLVLFLVPKGLDCTEGCNCGIDSAINTCISNSDLCPNKDTFIEPCHKYWSEFNVYTNECTERFDIGELTNVSAYVSNIEYKLSNTPVAPVSSNEGLVEAGKILLVSMMIVAKVTYVSNDGSNSIRQISLNIPASSHIIIDSSDFCTANKYIVSACLEDIFVCNLDGNNLFTNTTILIKAAQCIPSPNPCLY